MPLTPPCSQAHLAKTHVKFVRGAEIYLNNSGEPLLHPSSMGIVVEQNLGRRAWDSPQGDSLDWEGDAGDFGDASLLDKREPKRGQVFTGFRGSGVLGAAGGLLGVGKVATNPKNTPRVKPSTSSTVSHQATSSTVAPADARSTTLNSASAQASRPTTSAPSSKEVTTSVSSKSAAASQSSSRAVAGASSFSSVAAPSASSKSAVAASSASVASSASSKAAAASATPSSPSGRTGANSLTNYDGDMRK